MSDNLNALLQERAARVAEMRAMVDAAEVRGSTTAEDQTSIEGIESDIDGLDIRIGNLRTIARLEGAAANAVDELQDIGQRTQAGVAGGEIAGGEDAEYRDAFVAMLRGEATGDQLKALRRGYVNEESRDQTKGVSTKGGYVAPNEFEKTLLARVEEMSMARQVFTNVLRTANGNTIDMSAEDARGAAAWIDESGAFVATDDTFKTLSLEAWKAGRLAKASLELVEDTFFDLESYLATSIGTSIAVLEDAAFYGGDGVKKPHGAVTEALVGVTTASTTAISYDELMDLIYSVRPTYRQRAEFVVADLGVKALRKIKDANGMPIWQDGMRIGEPTSLLGYKVTTEVNLAAPAAGTKPILFGDASTYQIREVSGVRMAVLRERFLADEGKIGYLGWRRIDGQLLDTAGMKTLAMAAV